MRIVYGTGNRLGAGPILSQFLSHTNHTIKVAAHLKSKPPDSFIDWMLDAADSNIEQLQADIEEFDPDLVVSDAESYTANIAGSLNIPIIYCSPLHLLDGVVWERKKRSCSHILEKTKKILRNLPGGVIRLVYSPFGNLSNKPTLKEGYEWIQPYSMFSVDDSPQVTGQLVVVEDPVRRKNLEKVFNGSSVISSTDPSYSKLLTESQHIFISGETNILADCICLNKKISLIPDITDPEMLVNTELCSQYNSGADLGQIELLERYARSELEKPYNSSYTVVSENKFLHDRIEELWESM